MTNSIEELLLFMLSQLITVNKFSIESVCVREYCCNYFDLYSNYVKLSRKEKFNKIAIKIFFRTFKASSRSL